MTGHGPGPSTTASSWDKYWHGAQRDGAYSADGSSHPVVLAFWDEFFGSIQTDDDELRIVDIASGSGAVVECSKSVFDAQLPDVTCIDISDSAIRSLQQRFPDVHGVVADARKIPLASAHYGIVTSQFGIEYAGLDAIDEAIRLVAPHGRLALLIHHRDGGIYRQCAASLDATRQMDEANFITYAIDMFREGFEVLRGGDRNKYEAAARQFVPAIRALESIMKQHGQHVADGAVLRLYKDVRTIHERMPNYDPEEVLDWLRGMQGEIEAYAGRMQSMCDAAIDADKFDGLCRTVESGGFRVARRDPLIVPDRGEPIAWALVATRS